MPPTAIRRATACACLILAAALAPGADAGRARDVRVESFKLLNEGVSAYNRGLYAEAAEKLQQCAAMALNSFRAHYYLGLSLAGTRRYAEAIDALEIALDLDPDHLQALVALGDAQLKLGDTGESQAAFARALKLRPAHAPALDGVARTYEAQANDEEAVEYFRRALLSNKGYAPTYTHLGDLYLRQNRLGDAVRLLEEAVEIRPDYSMGLNRLAVAYGELGLTNEAVAAVKKAIELDPNNPFHVETLGWLQLGQGLRIAAEVSFLRALELEPRMPNTYRGLADLDRREGLYRRAVGKIDRGLALEGLNRAETLRLDTARAELIEEWRYGAQLMYRVAVGRAFAQEYVELAAIFAGRNRWNVAVDLQKTVATSAERREVLAYMLFRAGRYRDAQELYAGLAEELDRPGLRLNNGVTLAVLGDDRAAVKAYFEVLAADPSQALAHLYLGNALLRMGSPGEAAGSYRAYLNQGGDGETVERVRRILEQIAPDMLPPADSLVPDKRPTAAAEDEEES